MGPFEGERVQYSLMAIYYLIGKTNTLANVSNIED
jgi:hypothetical protein